MNVSLFVPCFVDALLPQAGIATVQVLERLGHRVDFPESQTCCGQPPYNSGCRTEAREVARRHLAWFREAEAVVCPSASCAAMVIKGYPDLFRGEPEEEAARSLASRTWEFSAFLVDRLGITDTGSRFDGRVTFHDGCHGLRELQLHRAPRTLLQSVRGLELVEMGEARSCCGFGGSFAVKFPRISTAMGEVKIKSILETGARAVVSCDPSCLMQIDGVLRHAGHSIRTLHLAEVLASI